MVAGFEWWGEPHPTNRDSRAGGNHGGRDAHPTGSLEGWMAEEGVWGLLDRIQMIYKMIDGMIRR